MVTLVLVVTALVLIAKIAEELPAATVTDVGTVATAVLLLARLTTAPPAGAFPARVTVPCEAAPPVTVAGLTLSVLNAGVTVSAVLCVAPLYVALIVTAVVVVTAPLVTLNVPLVLPAATNTLAGTPATAALLLDSVTVIPPAGAAAASVTVPTEPTPATTVLGDTDTDVSSGLTINVAVCVLPP